MPFGNNCICNRQIALALLVQLPYLLLMQLFPNRTHIHVITHTYPLSSYDQLYCNLPKISPLPSSFAKSNSVGSLMLERTLTYLYVVSTNRKAHGVRLALQIPNCIIVVCHCIIICMHDMRLSAFLSAVLLSAHNGLL